MRAVERIATCVAANREAEHLLTCLDPLPQFIIDNAELRHFGDLPLLAGIGTGDTLACAGVLDVAAAVPLEPPNVKDVVEKARAAFSLAADCVSPHGRPPGPGTPSALSRLAIACGLCPFANSVKMRLTIAASTRLICRSPVAAVTRS